MSAPTTARFPDPRWAWPPLQRRPLLEAALLPNEEAARAALQTWVKRYDLDDITYADHRLLAAITERHGNRLADLAEYPRLLGLQRQIWTHSRIRTHANLPILRTLQEAGINMILLKGAARIALNPTALRARAHGDIDILVREEQMVAATIILDQAGWLPPTGQTALSSIARNAHGINFQLPPLGDIDLHRRAYHGPSHDPECDAALSTEAEPVSYFGIPLLVASPHERLAMALAHGAWSGHSHSDWYLDLYETLQDPRLDWARVLNVLRKRHILAQAQIGLSYLQDGLGLPLPPAAQTIFTEAARLSWPVRANASLIARAPESLSPLPRRLRAWALKRAQRRSPQATDHIPPFQVTIAGNAGKAASQNVLPAALAHPIPLPAPALQGKILRLKAELLFPAPLRRRRVEFELNCAGHHLGRLRVLCSGKAKGWVRTKLKLDVQLPSDLHALTLEARPSHHLSKHSSAQDQERAQSVPFVLINPQWEKAR